MSRHLTCIVADGDFRLAHFGRYAGAPSGAGVYLLNFLKRNDLGALRDRALASGFLDDEKLAAMHRPQQYPELNVDTGPRVVDMLTSSRLRDHRAFACKKVCEWVYVIDLDQMVFEVHQGMQRGPGAGRFQDWACVAGEYPASMVANWPLDELPSGAEFLTRVEQVSAA